MALDIRTLLLVYALSNILQALCMQYVRRVHADYPAARLWAHGSLMLALGLVLLFLRGVVPPLVSIAIANSLILGGPMVMNFGTALAAGRRPPWRWGLGLLLVFFALFTWAVTAGQGLVTIDHRVAIFTLFALVIQVYAVTVCIRVAHSELRVSFYILAVLQFLELLVLLARLVAVFHSGLRDPFQDTTEQVLLYTFNIAFTFLTSVAFTVIAGQRLQMELHQLAMHAPLTQALNRREFAKRAERDWSSATRHSRPLTLLMIDVDHFKRINDECGHQVGDAVLVALVREVQALLRQADTLARYGGEEFAVVLPDTSQLEALEVAQRIRSQLARVVIPALGPDRHITVSIGVADNTQGLHWKAVLEAADQALYRAKQEGRNRVCAAQGEAPIPAV